MTNQHPTTTYQSVTLAPARKCGVKAVSVVYTVADRRGDQAVTVKQSGGYSCQCDVFALYGDCKHVDAVKAERKAEGRKF